MSVIGLRVGPFEIAEPVAVPEEGRWYLARRTGMTRRQPTEVLVCLLAPDAPPDARAALQRRFEALRAVEDPRIPEPVAFYEGTGALAVGAGRGTSLHHVIEARREGSLVMTPATLLDLVLEIAETLQHIHHKGKVHGHVSPENVLLAGDGRIWIWGLSTGPTTPPSPRWCPPERARGEPATEATDQWSLAALAAALITGHPPWTGADPAAEALRAEISPVVEPVERQWPALGRALRRMLDPRAANRFPTMHPVRQELLALARKAGGTSDRRELAGRLTTLGRGGAEAVPAHFQAASAAPAPVESAPPVADPVVDEVPAAPEAEVASSSTSPPSEAPSLRADGSRSDPPTSREPEDEIPVAVRAPEDEPARRPGGRLPEEQIPVVRPEVRGEVPMAKLGEPDPSSEARVADAPEDLGLPHPPHAAEPLEAALPEQQADLEPSEATVLFDASMLAHAEGFADVVSPPSDENDEPMDTKDPFDPTLLATPMYPDRHGGPDEEDSEAENATVVFDAALLGGQLAEREAEAALASEGAAGPTMVPSTDAEEDDEDVTVRFSDVDEPSGPSLGDLDDVADEPALPEPGPSLAVRAAPVLVGIMLVLMLAWLFVRFG